MFRTCRVAMLALWLAFLGSNPVLRAEPLRAGAAAADLEADDAMVIGGGIGPGKATGQEGKLRAVALVVEDGRKEKSAWSPVTF